MSLDSPSSHIYIYTVAIKPRHLNHHEVTVIISHAPISEPIGVTIYTALFAGLRIGEISQLTRSDIKRSLSTGMLSVRKEIAKAHIPRSIPVSPMLAGCFQMWLRRHDTFNVRNLSLWPCCLRTVQRRFSYFISTLPLIDRRITPHDLRHTFGAALYMRTRDLGLVQAALGHRRLSSTLIYVHVDGIIQEEIDLAYQTYNGLPSRKTYSVK